MMSRPNNAACAPVSLRLLCRPAKNWRKVTTKEAKLFRAFAATCGLLFLTWSGSSACWASPALSIGTSSIAPGGSGSVPAYLFGNNSGVAVQFDLVFDPSRIVAANVVPDGAAQNHLLVSGQPTNGVLRVVLYSLSNAQLGTGTLVDFQLAIAPSASEGPLVLQITNALMADLTGTSVQPIALQSGLLTISAGAGSTLALLARFANGQVQLQLSGPVNKNYILQSSPDLAQWLNISTNILTDGQILITNLPPPGSFRRFYRANYLP